MSTEKEPQQEMSFLQHLEELRWVLIRSILAIVIAGSLAFIFKNFIFEDVLLAPRSPEFISNRILCKISIMLNSEGLCINQHPQPLQNITMGGQFNMHIWISIVAGLIIAFPYIFYQIWSFISPALKSTEKKYARGAVFFSSLLFITGILFGFFVLLPFSIDFLTTYSVSDQIENKINFVSYISNITTVTLACGLIFELPIVVYFLSSIGILTPAFMKKYWRHAFIIILIIAAIITPPDVVSQALVSVPLFLLYWISIMISARVTAAKQKIK